MVSDLSATSNAVLENALLSDRTLKLPFISLIIVNYNYEAYIGATIQSIRQQHYSCFECIIVDNASTDDSIAIIESAVADDPRFTILKLDENIGQLRAVMRVFDRIKGSFVVVVDSDDLPDCIVPARDAYSACVVNVRPTLRIRRCGRQRRRRPSVKLGCGPTDAVSGCETGRAAA